MRRFLIILLALILVAAVPALAESKIGNWPNGRIWGDLQFYHSYESIRADGYTMIEQGYFSQDGTYRYDNHVYNIGIRISDSGDPAPRASITVEGQDSTPDDALSQYRAIIDEMVEKWGEPTAEYCQKPWKSSTDSIPEALSHSGEKFSYGLRWNEGRYSANISISSDINGVCSVSLIFFD